MRFIFEMLRTIVIGVPMAAIFSIANGQTAFDPPKDLPPIKLQMTDGTVFEKSAIKHDKPLLIIYFSPECEHCQELTKELIKNMSAFRDIHILMISFVPYGSIKSFEEQYHLKAYPNIKIGTEGLAFTVKNYLKLQRTPFVGLYNRQGMLVKAYDNNPPFDELIRLVKKTQKQAPGAAPKKK
jgi:thioredoxin-related protein